MAPRAVGALLALVAAIAFVVSVASSSWWSGHPSVNGNTITAKAVRVGLLGATGCNTGGDGTCTSIEVGSGFQTAGLIELAAIGVATVLAFMLAVSAWRIGDRRKQMGSMMLFVSALAAIGGVGVLAVGPALRVAEHVSVPIGWGVYVFGGGIVAALASSLVARGLEPEPLRLKSSSSHAQLAMPSNVRDVLREQHDGLRPTQLGPEPMLGPSSASSSNTRVSAPLFDGAPQLRPLYESEGFIPGPVTPPMPVSPPTPVPRQVVDALKGNTTPQPDLLAQRPRTPSGAPRTPNPDAPGALHALSPGVAPHARTSTEIGAPLGGSIPRTPNPASPSPGRAATEIGNPIPRTPNPDLASRPLGQAYNPSNSRESPSMRSGSPSSAPPMRSGSPSSAPPMRSGSPSSAPPMRSGSPSSAPPMRSGSPPYPPNSASQTRSPSSPSSAPPMRSGSPSSGSSGSSPYPPNSGSSGSSPYPPNSGSQTRSPSSPSSAPPMRSGSPSSAPPMRSGSPSSAPPMRSGSPSSGSSSSSPFPPSSGSRTRSPSTPSGAPPMRAGTPSGAPPMRAGTPSSAPPQRLGSPTSEPSGRPSVPMPARSSGLTAPRDTTPSAAPSMRPSQPGVESRATKAHAVPPMPTVENTPPPATLSARDVEAARSRRAATENDDRLDKSMRQTDFVTSVEIDAEAKALSRADDGMNTDPSVSALTGNPGAIGDSTETNLHILPEAESSAITPPPERMSRASGDEPSIAKPVTLELAAQTVLSDPSAMRISDVMSAPSGPRPTNEMTAQASIEEMQSGRPRTTFEMAAQTTLSAADPLLADSIPPRGTLTGELAAQQGESDAGDLTDPSRRVDTDQRSSGDTDLGAARDRTPMPTHAARGADHTPIPTKETRRGTLSTAPSHLLPPKATEVAASGPTPACPQCESPMAWVDEHLRFYCKQCRMYF